MDNATTDGFEDVKLCSVCKDIALFDTLEEKRDDALSYFVRDQKERCKAESYQVCWERVCAMSSAIYKFELQEMSSQLIDDRYHCNVPEVYAEVERKMCKEGEEKSEYAVPGILKKTDMAEQLRSFLDLSNDPQEVKSFTDGMEMQPEMYFGDAQPCYFNSLVSIIHGEELLDESLYGDGSELGNLAHNEVDEQRVVADDAPSRHHKKAASVYITGMLLLTVLMMEL